ncbi:hypothetical protein X777_16960 [Ooceraea biroi]|uniref:Uncharacterized protein n=1 Tax=Ooceraea biroi TaxID=2015173 RepID=A0A026WSH4_OOCBI|nr:hypothetical protein X777_16960 [Ooceraea biroi]
MMRCSHRIKGSEVTCMNASFAEETLRGESVGPFRFILYEKRALFYLSLIQLTRFTARSGLLIDIVKQI